MDPRIAGKKILITGGAGFIGSHLAEYCLTHGAALVIVMDNLCTGYRHNIAALESNPAFEFLQMDIRDYEACEKATKHKDIVLHNAALGSVPRSIEDPISTHSVNVDGFFNILHASYKNKVRHFIYASSSSVYGDNEDIPKLEEKTGNPLSPYALTKSINEKYAEIFYQCYNYPSIGLRYFNVFGPRQDPQGPYAAVIPRFIQWCLEGKPLQIYGDGTVERDFTYVYNVVEANMKAVERGLEKGSRVYNVGCGYATTINALAEKILKLYSEIDGQQSRSVIQYCPPRPGDIKRSTASIERISQELDFTPSVLIDEGLRETMLWFMKKFASA